MTDERKRIPAPKDTAQLLGLGQDASMLDVDREVHRIFRSTFSTPDGKKALNILLTKLCYFDIARTEQEQALANFADYLRAELLGAVDTIRLTDAIIEAAEENL